MKKLFALLLVAAMCFSLVACGEDRDYEAKIEKYEERMEELEELLAERDAEIERLLAALNSTGSDDADSDAGALGNEDSSDDSVTDEENEQTMPEELVGNLSNLCGDWHILNRESVGKIEKITISEDGVFVCDDKTYLWVFDYKNDSNLQVDLFDGENKVGYFRLNFLEGGDISGLVSLESMDTKLALYKPSHYEIIDITLDNLQEYFEIVEYMTYLDNAFGEAVSCFFRTELQLKKEYWGRLSENLMDDIFDNNVIDNGAIEFSYDYGTRVATIDLANRTYSYGKFTATESRTATTEFSYVSNDDGNYIYAHFETDNIGSYEIEHGLLDTARDNFEPVRIRLVIYLIAE